jgi:hypothetical protein
MKLVIPPEFRDRLSSSMFLTGQFRNHTLKALFMSPENVRYLGNELMATLSHPTYILHNIPQMDNAETDSDLPDQTVDRAAASPGFAAMVPEVRREQVRRLMVMFRQNETLIRDMVPALIRAHDNPLIRDYYQDQTIPNPILLLSQQNLELIQHAGKNFIQSPEQIDPSMARFSPDTGRIESTHEYDYGAESWADGTWHPEHLFSNNQRNRENPYWVPLEVSVQSQSGMRLAAIPGHKYDSPLYGADPEIRGAATSAAQFPRWQRSANGRNGLSRTVEGYDEAGEGDRRVSGTHGFDGRALRSRGNY